jgi:hypothetical protein
MGYQIYVQKFENGDSASVSFEDVSTVLSSYGEIVEGDFGLQFLSSVGEICDFASLSGDKDTGISGITFDRPTTHEKLPEIIFDLLGLKNTCFFGPDLEFVQTRSDMLVHYPSPLIEDLPSGPETITSATGSWPLN